QPLKIWSAFIIILAKSLSSRGLAAISFYYR
ncbi:MAG: hypothetical protein ACI9T9_002325, partial [Oleiphilaceae bacterium]